MITLEVFDHSSCNIEGCCGGSAATNPDLIRINDIFELFQQVPPIDATRYELSQHADIFEKNDKVMTLLEEKGKECLPITVLNGDIVKYGDYPSNEEVSSYTGILIVDNDGGCCGGGGCGCSCSA